MSHKLAALLILALLLCSCATTAPTLTSTAMPASSPTFIPSTTTLSPPPPTRTTLPTSTPIPSTETATSTPTFTSTPTSQPTPTSTPLPSWPNDFQLGAVTENTSRHADLMLSSGMSWVKKRITHGRPSPGSQSLISQAHGHGLQILLTVRGDGQRIYEDDYQTQFVSYLATLAQQGADAIEVWDEPNIARNIAREMVEIDPAQYTALLCAAYTAIKEANSETLVISGAPAPGGVFGGCTSEGCDDLPWMQELAGAGAAECLDFVGAIYTLGATSPEESSGHPAGEHPTFYFGPTVEQYHRAFGGVRPLAFTGFGYFSPEGYEEPPAILAWASNTTVTDQATWTAEAVRMSIDSGKVSMIIIYNLDSTGWTSNDPRTGWALIRKDEACPTCEALRQLLLQP